MEESPWWATKQNEVFHIMATPSCDGSLYARKFEGKWEIAYTEWRSGTAYLFALIRDGKNVLLDCNQLIYEARPKYSRKAHTNRFYNDDE